MRLSIRLLARAAFIVSTATSLAGCGDSDKSSSTPPANQVTAEVEVHRSFPSCDVTVKVHNGTTYHLTEAAFGITGYDHTFDVKDIIVGGDGSDTMSIPIDDKNPSCLAVARKIEPHATDNNVGTCTMDGANEGDCQHLFAFSSAIDPHAIQADIDKLKAGDLKVGDAVPLKNDYGVEVDITTDGTNPVTCADNSHPTWTPAVVDISRDGDGVADDYQIAGACQNGDTVHGWVEARQ